MDHNFKDINMNKQKIGILGGSALCVIGSVLPWVSVSLGGKTFSVSGMDAGGAVTLLLAAVCAVFAIMGNKTETVKGWKFWTVFGIAVFNALIAVIKIGDASAASAKLGGAASVGIGLFVILAGAAATAVLTFLFKKSE